MPMGKGNICMNHLYYKGEFFLEEDIGTKEAYKECSSPAYTYIHTWEPTSGHQTEVVVYSSGG